MNVLSAAISNKILLPVFIIFLLVFIYSLFWRKPDIDDAWIGVDAYTLAIDGYAHTDLMRGINQQEELFVVGHKFFNLQGALFIKVFGFSLYTLKAISLIYFLVFIWLFYAYTIKWKKLLNKQYLLFSLIMILVFPPMFKYSFVYRPEVSMMTLGFAGFILMEKFIESPVKKPLLIFFSGILFGLTMATHLNGIILVSSAFFLLIWTRNFLAIPLYGLGALLAFMVYFYDYTGLSYFELWYLQFSNAPYLDSLTAGLVWLKPVFNLITEHIRYFHNPRIIFFSIFMIVTIIIGFKFLYKNYTNLMRFSILITIITGMVAMHKAVHYLLINIPYFIILIVLTFKSLYEKQLNSLAIDSEKKQTSAQFLLLGLCIVFISISTYYNILLAMEKFNSEENHNLTEKYTDSGTREMNIVAPMTFIFNEITEFKSIQGDLSYYELQKLDPSIKGPGLLRKAETFDISLMMISKYYHEPLGISEYEIHDTIGQFHVLDKNDELLVFKRLQ